MTTPLRLHGALLLATSLVVACGPDAAPTPAPAVSAETGMGAGETGAEAEAGTPKIASDAPIFEFGAIKPTESIEHVFAIKNEGSADLKIESVQRT